MAELAGRWWVINEAELRAVLRRAAAGEDPDVLYVELLANSEGGHWS